MVAASAEAVLDIEVVFPADAVARLVVMVLKPELVVLELPASLVVAGGATKTMLGIEV